MWKPPIGGKRDSRSFWNAIREPLGDFPHRGRADRTGQRRSGACSDDEREQVPRVRRASSPNVCDSARARRAAVATKLPSSWGSRRVGEANIPCLASSLGLSRGVRALDDNHELSSGVAFSLVSESLGNLAQLVAAIDDRRDLSGLDELPQDHQIVPGMPRNEDAHPLSHER